MAVTLTPPTLDDVQFLEGELFIPPGLPYSDWERLFESLQFRERNISFWVGDAYNYAQEHYGEKFSQALPTVGYSLRTIQNAASVAKAIPVSRRREDIPFSYHAAVASLPPEQQDELLKEAATEEIRLGQLRSKVRHLKATEKPDPEAYTWTLACSVCQETGPQLDCKPGWMSMDRGGLCEWLGDHKGHEVRLLGDEQIVGWRASLAVETRR